MIIDNNRSITDVLQDILGNLQNLIRSEVRLAKASQAAVLMGVGAVAGLFALVFLLLAGLFALGIVIPLWASALVIFGIVGVVAAALLSAGKKRFQTVQPKPDKTIATVKENVEWVKQHAK